MDEIHVASDVSYKGGRIIDSCVDPEHLIRTIFAIMASSLDKKWSTVVRLVPLSTTSAKDIYPVIFQVIADVERCGLFKYFMYYAQTTILETSVYLNFSLLIRKHCNHWSLISSCKQNAYPDV